MMKTFCSLCVASVVLLAPALPANADQTPGTMALPKKADVIVATPKPTPPSGPIARSSPSNHKPAPTPTPKH